MGLFRSAAVDASQHRLEGHVVLLPRIPHSFLCAFLVAWTTAVAVFLTQASYSRRATVSGWLEPASGAVRVYPSSEGRLSQWLVRDGDTVVRGQPLAVINGGRVLDDGQRLEAVLLAEYQDQITVLERQLARETALLSVRQNDLRRQLAVRTRELAVMGRQIDTLEARAALLKRRRARHEEQQLVLASQRQAIEIDQARGLAQRQELAGRLSRLPGQSANTLDRLRLQRSELSQAVARLRGNRAQVIEAPLTGRVSNIALRPGQKARYETPILTLIPRDSPLVAQLLVPVRAAGFLEPGQDLTIRYDAFPYQKYGMQRGRVIHVADSATLPGEHQALPFRVSEPVYRLTARPDQSSLLRHGETVALKAGMTLSADIVLERRSLLEWLLEPLLMAGSRLT